MQIIATALTSNVKLLLPLGFHMIFVTWNRHRNISFSSKSTWRWSLIIQQWSPRSVLCPRLKIICWGWDSSNVWNQKFLFCKKAFILIFRKGGLLAFLNGNVISLQLLERLFLVFYFGSLVLSVPMPTIYYFILWLSILNLPSVMFFFFYKQIFPSSACKKYWFFSSVLFYICSSIN